MIWYGDSISENMRGTEIGVPDKYRAAIQAVYEQHMSKYRTVVFGCSHDRMPNTNWRIRNGETPKARR
jgi:hypothetical protein